MHSNRPRWADDATLVPRQNRLAYCWDTPSDSGRTRPALDYTVSSRPIYKTTHTYKSIIYRRRRPSQLKLLCGVANRQRAVGREGRKEGRKEGKKHYLGLDMPTRQKESRHIDKAFDRIFELRHTIGQHRRRLVVVIVLVVVVAIIAAVAVIRV